MIDPKPVQASARTLSAVLLVLQSLLVAAGIAVAALTTLMPAAMGGFLLEALGHEAVAPRPWQSLALASLALAQVIFLYVLTGHMRAIFTALDGLDPDGAARAARRTSWWLWGLLVWGVAAPAVASVTATWHFPAGERALTIGFGSAELTTALAALLAAFMARALALGAELWRDHRVVI
ncbi:MAG: hypothetical protein AAGF30_00900 [Pseudomonadota bacterium]